MRPSIHTVIVYLSLIFFSSHVGENRIDTFLKSFFTFSFCFGITCKKDVRQNVLHGLLLSLLRLLCVLSSYIFCFYLSNVVVDLRWLLIIWDNSGRSRLFLWRGRRRQTFAIQRVESLMRVGNQLLFTTIGTSVALVVVHCLERYVLIAQYAFRIARSWEKGGIQPSSTNVVRHCRLSEIL